MGSIVKKGQSLIIWKHAKIFLTPTNPSNQETYYKQREQVLLETAINIVEK